MIKKGLVHIYTGDGKGKTTAAIGLALRARGANLSVLVAQLFKEKNSEAKSLEKLGIAYLNYSTKHPFFKKYSEKELASEAEKCIFFVKRVFEMVRIKSYDLIVLDEIGPALAYNLVKEDELAEMIKSKPGKTELVMTGRGFPESIIKLADYVTEMRKVRHPYDKGVNARKGIEH
ncbi:MAG TPA: cob(I)yrinic acid a,c-diamide adenosyltransferase [Candidatus Nanoarchaeia archaeon]|nr:cob(I)yrinic acid a,c-diamide adenosyltransferase [Candidatus Nanoarchaeia archaeon]